jgi:hypothetical protein
VSAQVSGAKRRPTLAKTSRSDAGAQRKKKGHGRLGRERNCTANPKKIHANKNSHTKPQSREESWRSRLSLGTRLIPEALVVLDGGHFQSQIFSEKN